MRRLNCKSVCRPSFPATHHLIASLAPRPTASTAKPSHNGSAPPLPLPELWVEHPTQTKPRGHHFWEGRRKKRKEGGTHFQTPANSFSSSVACPKAKPTTQAPSPTLQQHTKPFKPLFHSPDHHNHRAERRRTGRHRVRRGHDRRLHDVHQGRSALLRL